MTLYGAITDLVMMREHPMMPSMFYSSLDKIIETVSECEEPERKKGKWIWQTENRYVCSECGHHTQVDELFEEPMYAFCPYCSTSMLDKDGNVRYER